MRNPGHARKTAVVSAETRSRARRIHAQRKAQDSPPFGSQARAPHHSPVKSRPGREVYAFAQAPSAGPGTPGYDLPTASNQSLSLRQCRKSRTPFDSGEIEKRISGFLAGVFWPGGGDRDWRDQRKARKVLGRARLVE